jgi:hypothetical protein
VQLDSKVVPPFVFFEQAPRPTFAMARLAMELPLTDVTAAWLVASRSSGPEAGDEQPAATPATTNARVIGMCIFEDRAMLVPRETRVFPR